MIFVWLNLVGCFVLVWLFVGDLCCVFGVFGWDWLWFLDCMVLLDLLLLVLLNVCVCAFGVCFVM